MKHSNENEKTQRLTAKLDSVTREPYILPVPVLAPLRPFFICVLHIRSLKLQLFRDMGFIPVEQGDSLTKLLICKCWTLRARLETYCLLSIRLTGHSFGFGSKRTCCR